MLSVQYFNYSQDLPEPLAELHRVWGPRLLPQLRKFGAHFGESRIGASQVRRMLRAGFGLSGTHLDDAADVSRVLHRVQDYRQRYVRVADRVDRIDSEMTPDSIQVVHVVMDATGQFLGVADGIRKAAIAQVISDDRASAGKAFEVIEQIDPVGDHDWLRTIPQHLKE
jgi:hypothetical protein